MKLKLDRSVVSWALYDWANSAFATTVMAGFFPVFFKSYWDNEATAATSTFHLGVSNSVASLVIMLLAPVLGAIADSGGTRRRFLGFFAFMGALSTLGLLLVAEGHWMLAALLYGFGTIGFSGANTFYDSLLVEVSDEKRVDWISAFGFSMGYLGGGLLFGLNVWMVSSPDTFGFSGPMQAVRFSFLTVGVWWAVFSLPVLLWVKERPGTRVGGVRKGLLRFRKTLGDLRRLRVVFLFLIGYWLYIDGVDTIVRMAVDYGLSIGFRQEDLLLALLITQLVGFPSALVIGRLAIKWGPRRGIFCCIAVYVGITIWAVFITSVIEFYLIAVAVGLVQGGIQALSRSFYSRLIPKNRNAEFFGFYNMLGKFAAVIGPLLMGLVGVLTGSPRLSILSIIILFLGGAYFLSKVDAAEGRRQAAQLEAL